MSPSRSVLLVGEGNFSFSASLSQWCCEAETSIITATCPQHQDEALQHEGAASNIQVIKDSGGDEAVICAPSCDLVAHICVDALSARLRMLSSAVLYIPSS